ncbi:MAG: hypothetical protein ABR581_04940 [Thermoleophilaceae bacterium]
MNPVTGQLEDDGQGMPQTFGQVQGVPLDQVAPAAPGPAIPPGVLAANARAGQDLSQPVVIDRGGNDAPPLALPPQTPVASPAPVTPQPPPGMVRESETRTREVVSPEERRAMQALRGTDQEAVRLAGQQGEVGQAQAQATLESAQQRAQLGQQQAAEKQAQIAEGQRLAAEAKAQYDGERQKLAGMDVKDFWSTRTTGQKVAGAIALAMGAVGGVLTGKGGNVAMDVIGKAIDDDYRVQRAHIEVQKDKVAGARENLAMSNEERARRLSELDVKQTAIWQAVGDAAQVKAAQVGTQAAAVQGQVIKNAADQKAQAHYQQWLEGMRTKVQSTSVQGTGAAGGVAGKASSEDLAKIGSLDNDIKNVDRMIATIKANPGAWNEYRKNEESWQRAEAFGKTKLGGELRGYAQAAGAGDVTPEQGLKSPEAKQIHQGLQAVKIGLAKGYGGVITGGDLQAASTEMTTMANDPRQAMETLLRLRDRMSTSRQVYLQNRNVQAPQTAPTPSIGGGGQGPDPAKVQMARQRLQANPNDQVAKDWLAAHGL